MQTLLAALKNQNVASHFRRGLEKECLRVTPEGVVSTRPHGEALGSALTHPYITTDYSEALLEFVTPVFEDPKKLLSFLQDIHVFVAKNVDGELLWANSMPCLFRKDEEIPIAQYGSSHIAQMKSTYRRGLYHRYGSAMQAIAGIHFNFSLTDELFTTLQKVEEHKGDLQEYKSRTYMNAVRNLHRYSWVVPYFFGSSPTICKSFLSKTYKDFNLKEFDDQGTLYFEGATSLRLSNLGYTNEEQEKIAMCYNTIETYARSLKKAITESVPAWEKIGVEVDGAYKQLNTAILQLENEYYAGVRPKRRTESGEAPTNALLSRGVEYLELRSLDLNTYSAIGIELDQILFLDLFVFYCLLKPSLELSPEQTQAFRKNQEVVAKFGRTEFLQLFDGDGDVPISEWAKFVLGGLEELASLLGPEYEKVLTRYRDYVDQPAGLSSARLVEELKTKDETFFRNTLNRSESYSRQLETMPLQSETQVHFVETARTSLEKQKSIESGDEGSFTEFLQAYDKRNGIER